MHYNSGLIFLLCHIIIANIELFFIFLFLIWHAGASINVYFFCQINVACRSMLISEWDYILMIKHIKIAFALVV